MFRSALIWGIGLICLGAGCSKSEQTFKKTTVKVTGTITVNGGPPESVVQLEARPKTTTDTEHPSASTAVTNEDGTFEFSTYSPGDGVPEGQYYLLAKSQAMNMLTRENDGVDKLGGKYDTISKSPKEFEVPAEGEPIDLGTIDLKATAKKK